MEKDEIGVGFMDEGPTESSSPKEEAKTGLSFSVLPGFKCFFQNSVLKDNLTLQECYERVMKDHFVLQKMRLPTEQLFNHSRLTLAERSK